jgi:PAS domain S-box-containing protein
MVEASPCGLMCLNRKGVIVDANPAAADLLQINRDRLVGHHAADLDLTLICEDGSVLPVDRRVVEELFRNGVAIPAATVGIRRQDGQVVWLQYTLTPARGESNAVEGTVVTLTDISELRRGVLQLRENEARFRKLADANRRLLNEVNHRVRNNLASLLAMIGLMRQRAVSVDVFAAAVESRVTALTQIHGLLVEAHWGDVDLRTLVTRLLTALHPTAPHNIAVQIDGPRVAVSARETLPLAMTFWELFANSCKHGAHSLPTGQLTVAWQVRQQSGQATVELLWRERGGPAITAEPVASLGLELIGGFVGHELGGRCALHFPSQGAEHSISFPVAPAPSVPSDAPRP